MSEREYIEALEALEARKCGHALMATLRRGFSKANVMYLRHVQKSLTPDPSPVERGEKAENFGVKVLYVRKSKLFGQRASLSNKMCDLPEGAEYDKKRAEYSADIQAVQRDIEDVMRQISAAERGEMPESETPDLPTNEADLLRRLASLRASRSRQRGIEKTAKGDKLSKCREELTRLEKLITDVETAISQYN